MPDTYTLSRSGRAPLTFTGELLAESDGERCAGKEQNRWHDLAVYRTTGGKYIVAIQYRTRWEGELSRDKVEISETAVAVACHLEEYNPTAAVRGFPAGDAYAERQARLLADIRQRYEAQVSEILGAMPEAAEDADSPTALARRATNPHLHMLFDHYCRADAMSRAEGESEEMRAHAGREAERLQHELNALGYWPTCGTAAATIVEGGGVYNLYPIRRRS